MSLCADLAVGVDSKMVSHFLGDLLNSLAGIAFADGIFRHRSVKRNRTIDPEILTPFSNACIYAIAPGNDGNSDG